MAELDLDYIHRLVVSSRAAQGLPPTVEDEVVLAKIAAILTQPQLPMTRRSNDHEEQ